MKTKIKSAFLLLICLILALILRLFTDLNIVIIIDILIFVPGFLIAYILSSNMKNRYGRLLFYITILISSFFVKCFMNSNLYLNLSIKDWEKSIIKNIGAECENGCSIEGRAVYNNNKNVVIYKWDGLSYVYDGSLKKVKNQIEYEISLEDKCITKKENEKYLITNGKCN